MTPSPFSRSEPVASPMSCLASLVAPLILSVVAPMELSFERLSLPGQASHAPKVPVPIWFVIVVFGSFRAQVSQESITMTGSHDHTHADHSHDHGDAQRWKHDGVRVIPGDQLDPNVPSTAGMDRKAAINFARVGAPQLRGG